MSDVVRVQPLLSLFLLGGCLGGSQMRGAAHHNVWTELFIASRLCKQCPEVGFTVVLGAAPATPETSGNFGLGANVPTFCGAEEPLFRFAVVLLCAVSVGVTHSQRVFRSDITRNC